MVRHNEPPTDEDPKFSCPIVCGEYMRATGFFFETEHDMYLVTARHNVLPTQPTYENLAGDSITMATTTDTLPQIDVYLRTDTTWDQFRFDIRTVEGVRQSSDIDVIGVPIDIRPREYGYRVWTMDTVSDGVHAASELRTVGFNGESFPHPDRNYDVQHYCEAIGLPRHLSITNDVQSFEPSDFRFMIPGIDEHSNEGYNGFSGAPVTDDESLIGIHSCDTSVPPACKDQFGADSRGVVYTRAAVLNQLLDRPTRAQTA